MQSQFQSFLQFLTIPFVNLNFIDILIVLVIIFFVIEGYALGFIRGMADFLSFILAFIFALTFYDIFAIFLTSNFSIPTGFANGLGFFIAALLAEIFLSYVFRKIVVPFIDEKAKEMDFSEELDKYLGIIPGILSGAVLLSFLFTLIVAFPFSPFLAKSISSSKLGNSLVSNIQGLDKELNKVFGGTVNDALTFFTVEPKSDELLKLNFTTSNTNPDPESENEMFVLVNKERKKANLEPVEVNEVLIETARKHCSDMFDRGYFSHYTPEGKSPFDRMAEDNIRFTNAGENLALAPNSELAMKGLMNSPGHRANILSKNFGEVGIGVIDGGVYGKMFCQEFKD